MAEIDEQQAIARDSEEYPDCYHSTHVKKSCTLQEGNKFVCDTMRQIQRMCPGERPTTIFHYNKNSNSEDSSSADMGDAADIFHNLFNHVPHNHQGALLSPPSLSPGDEFDGQLRKAMGDGGHTEGPIERC